MQLELNLLWTTAFLTSWQIKNLRLEAVFQNHTGIRLTLCREKVTRLQL